MSKARPEQPIGTSPRVRDQPSLTTASGRTWLICGGLLGLIAIAVLIPLLASAPAGLALFGICAVVALYAAMVIARINAPPGRVMLALLAAFMIAMALVGLICVGTIAATVGNLAL